MSEGEGGSESTQQDPQDSVWQPGGGAGPRLLTSSQAEGEGEREGGREREREGDYTPSCHFIRYMQLNPVMLSV